MAERVGARCNVPLLNLGDIAPDFELTSDSGERVRLHTPHLYSVVNEPIRLPATHIVEVGVRSDSPERMCPMIVRVVQLTPDGQRQQARRMYVDSDVSTER